MEAKKIINAFDLNRKIRLNILKLLSGMSIDQLNTIPKGYKNNLVWNFGHLLVSQQLLIYWLSGQKILLDKTLIDEFKKGSHPEKTYSKSDIEALKANFIEIINSTEKASQSGLLTENEFNVYTTSYNVTLSSVMDAIIFNNTHEAMHLGIMMSMIKLV